MTGKTYKVRAAKSCQGSATQDQDSGMSQPVVPQHDYRHESNKLNSRRKGLWYHRRGAAKRLKRQKEKKTQEATYKYPIRTCFSARWPPHMVFSGYNPSVLFTVIQLKINK